MKSNKKMLARKKKPKELIWINVFFDGVKSKRKNSGYYVVCQDKKGRFIRFLKRKCYLINGNSIQLDIKTIGLI